MINRLLKLFIAIIFHFFYRLLIILLLILKKQIPNTFVILTYHSVKSDQCYKFQKHMDKLLHIGNPVHANFNNALNIGRHNIAVTFDDGYQNIIYHALPILLKRNIPATLFITTGYIGKNADWISDPKHENFNETLITEKQLEQLPNHLISIGSHCVTHPHLNKINEEKILTELKESKRTLEEILDADIYDLALPYGYYNEKIIELSKFAGYKRIFLSDPIFPSTKIDDFLFGRIDISLDDWMIEYHLKMLGAYQWLPLAINLKQKMKNLASIFVTD